jgi:hypothetical protein
VFQKCLAKKHRLICAGEVLALRDLMELRGWASPETPRSCRMMLRTFLTMEKILGMRGKEETWRRGKKGARTLLSASGFWAAAPRG